MLKFPEETIINIDSRNQKLMYFGGLLAMLLNKIRRSIKRYSNPRPFSLDDINRNIEYVLNVVDNWQKGTRIYTGKDEPFSECSILEIGPGPDLGTGIIMLSLGARKYRAIDMFPLAVNTPASFYKGLFEAISNNPYVENAHKSFREFSQKGFSDNFNYQQVEYPRLTALPQNEFDIVISQAVWEHIIDPETTLLSLINSAKKGAYFINEVDLSTHTRIVRDIDPLNLLRYGNGIYDRLSFPGAPNRLRSSDYLQLSNKIGLQNTYIIPIRSVDNEYINAIRPKLSYEYQIKEPKDLAMLSCWWLAMFPVEGKLEE